MMKMLKLTFLFFFGKTQAILDVEGRFFGDTVSVSLNKSLLTDFCDFFPGAGVFHGDLACVGVLSPALFSLHGDLITL